MVSKVPSVPGNLSCASHLGVALDGHEQVRPGVNLHCKREGLSRLRWGEEGAADSAQKL